jgi:hypothetical protein
MSREVHVQFWERMGGETPPRDSPTALQAERDPGTGDRIELSRATLDGVGHASQ